MLRYGNPGGGGTPMKKISEMFVKKNWIPPLMETNLGMAHILFDP